MTTAWGWPRRADDRDRFPNSRAGRHHVVHNQHPALQRGAHQRAALAMILGLLAVVGKRNVAPEPRQFDGHRSTERDTLVGRAENHVELNAAADQGLCIELRKPAQFGAIIEQAGIEEVGDMRPALVLNSPKRRAPDSTANWTNSSASALPSARSESNTMGISLFKLTSLNLNGIRSATTKGLEPWMRQHRADCICVQEVKAQAPDVIGRFDELAGLKGYFHFAEKGVLGRRGVFTARAQRGDCRFWVARIRRRRTLPGVAVRHTEACTVHHQRLFPQRILRP